MAVGVWRAAGVYSGWKIWPVLARLAVLLGAGLLAVSLFNGVRDAADWDGLDFGTGPSVQVPSFTVANRSGEEIAAVRAKPSATSGWGGNEVARAPILPGESRVVSLLRHDYSDRCRFDVRAYPKYSLGLRRHAGFRIVGLCYGNRLRCTPTRTFGT